VAAFGNAEQFRPTASGHLSRDEPQPGCEIAGSGEAPRITDSGYQSLGVQGADPGNGRQALCGLLTASCRDELAIECCNPTV